MIAVKVITNAGIKDVLKKLSNNPVFKIMIVNTAFAEYNNYMLLGVNCLMQIRESDCPELGAVVYYHGTKELFKQLLNTLKENVIHAVIDGDYE